MKRFAYLVCILVTCAFTTKDAAVKSTAVAIAPESSLMVTGTTNVNSFKCVYNIDSFKNPIPVYYQTNSGKIHFKKTALVLDNKAFDCGGRAINRDFQQLLKSDEYPHISLILKEINEASIDNKAHVDVLVDLEIAGIKKPYTIPVMVEKKQEIVIIGGLNICLSDFNITAPKKFFGLISIDNEIAIDFRLVVDEV